MKKDEDHDILNLLLIAREGEDAGKESGVL